MYICTTTIPPHDIPEPTDAENNNQQEGDDDMFSADLSSEERHSRLGHMASVPTAVFLSGADQFVPPLPADPEGGGGRSPVEALAETFRAAMISSSSSSSTSPPTVDGVASSVSGSAAIGSDAGARSGRRIADSAFSPFFS